MKIFPMRIILSLVLGLSLAGCSTFDRARKADLLEMRVGTLLSELKALEKSHASVEKRLEERGIDIRQARQQLAACQQQAAAQTRMTTLCQEEAAELRAQLRDATSQILTVKETADEKKQELTRLQQAHQDLRASLADEIADYKARLEMTERGLVITFLAEIFFDSGKSELRQDAKVSLRKVAEILKGGVKGSDLAIEGHTDNVPIRHSPWKSNWELSVHRSLAVLHYFINETGIDPRRLSAVGYGEFRPVASNDTESGRQQNRRVEIVVLPEKEIPKVKPSDPAL